jgi:septal ring factor EnvC (AmiA/AmiB activator)
VFWAGTLLLCSTTQAAAVSSGDLDQIRSQIEQLRKANQTAQANRSDVADALQASERAISDANRRVVELNRQQHGVDSSLAALSASSANMKQQISKQQSALAALLRQQYQAPKADAAKLLLNGENPNQIARNLAYYTYVSRERAVLIAALRNSEQRLASLTQAQTQKKAQLDAIQQQRLAQRQRLVLQRQEKQQVLEKLGTQIQQQRKQLATLERDQKHLTQLFEALARAAAKKAAAEKLAAEKAAAKQAAAEKRAAQQARKQNTTRPEPPDVAQPPRVTRPEVELPQAALNGTQFGRLKGKLSLPAQGELVYRFGTPREQGGALWKGIFIRANTGQSVHAVAAGQVVFADWLRGFGNLIIVDHGSGYMSLYSNNESLYKRVGDRVSARETLATVGNSGGNPEAGLYFELRYQSRAFDPMPWMAGK